MHQDLPHDRILAQEGHGLHGRCRQFTVDVELAIVSRDDPNSVAGSREDLWDQHPHGLPGWPPAQFRERAWNPSPFACRDSRQRVALPIRQSREYTVALLATLEEKLDCVIAGIAPSDFVDLARAHSHPSVSADARAILQTDPTQTPSQVPDDRAPSSVDPHCAALWEHWQRPTIAWYNGARTCRQDAARTTSAACRP